MKHLLLILLFLPTIMFGTQCYTTSDGDWSDNIWSWGTPSSGDTIIINHIVVISSPNLTLGNSTRIVINDTLIFNKGKLVLGCGSVIVISGGGYLKSDDNGNNEKINICSNQVWTTNDGPLSGPLNIDEFGVGIPLFLHNNTIPIVVKDKDKEQLIEIGWWDIIGQPVTPNTKGIIIIMYDDGARIKMIRCDFL